MPPALPNALDEDSRPRDVVRIDDRFYVLATSALADDRTRVLKAGRSFAVFDRHGDFQPLRRGELGLYHCDTRFLSCLELRVAGQRPLLLHSTVTEDNAFVAVDLANPTLVMPGGERLPQDVLHLFRAAVLLEGELQERIRVRSYAAEPVRLALALAFGADFADVFEVRGMRRAARGEVLAPELGRDGVVLSYRGRDGVLRRCALRFDPAPAQLEAGEATFELAIAPRLRSPSGSSARSTAPGTPPPPTGTPPCRALALPWLVAAARAASRPPTSSSTTG